MMLSKQDIDYINDVERKVGDICNNTVRWNGLDLSETIKRLVALARRASQQEGEEG